MANYQEWSESYFPDLTSVEHNINNNWFASMLSMLKDDGVLFVPVLNKQFNKLGEELWTLKTSIVTPEQVEMVRKLHALSVKNPHQYFTLVGVQ